MILSRLIARGIGRGLTSPPPAEEGGPGSPTKPGFSVPLRIKASPVPALWSERERESIERSCCAHVAQQTLDLAATRPGRPRIHLEDRKITVQGSRGPLVERVRLARRLIAECEGRGLGLCDLCEQRTVAIERVRREMQ